MHGDINIGVVGRCRATWAEFHTDIFRHENLYILSLGYVRRGYRIVGLRVYGLGFEAYRVHRVWGVLGLSLRHVGFLVVLRGYRCNMKRQIENQMQNNMGTLIKIL